MMRRVTLSILLLLLFSLPVLADEKTDMAAKKIDDINYSQGHSLGQRFGKLAAELKMEDFLAGIYDAEEKIEPRLAEEARRALLSAKSVTKAKYADFNYSYGYEIGKKFQKAKIEVLPDALTSGFIDGLDRLEPQVEDAKMEKLLSVLDGEKS